jgi:cellulose synthase/poly-beta-1,6-N-acetylglucosamine synthase-like glycosyltransferase
MSGRTEIRPSPARREHIWVESLLRQSLHDYHLRAAAKSSEAMQPANDFPELDCVRDQLPLATTAAAERRALAAGVTADRVLITSGLMSEEAYVRALAQSLGLAFEPLETPQRAACPISDERLIEASAAGLLPLTQNDALTLVVAPRGVAARRLYTIINGAPELRRRIRLTSSERLAGFIHRNASRALGKRAAFGLLTSRPVFSAAPREKTWLLTPLFAMAAVLGAVIVAPNLVATGFSVAFSLVFIAWIGLRLIGLFAAAKPPRRLPRRPDVSLPIYTVIVALYREVAAIKQLIACLNALDWPPEKLDIKLVLEPDDHATRAALEAMRLGLPYELVIVPAVGPRTKPKALNAALPFARGTFVTVFDAEDRPEADQLRRALEAFLSHDERLACVQAQLTIDNTKDNWLTRMFTAEYAGLFDVLLPGLARLRLPLPLGGSSNHFRTAVLRAIGGWDAHNLTEDADLGMRLARFGYVSAVIASTTYEEAPARFFAWLKQRRRWFQGWMQTWIVHMRAPFRLMRELGPLGFITLQLVVGGTVLAALVHPVFLAALALDLATAEPRFGENRAEIILSSLYWSTLIGGYATSAVLGLVGLAQRRLLSTAWVLLLVPVHWLLLSLAAWQALWKLVRDPYRWDKTEHGLARTSRRASHDRAADGAKPAQGRFASGDIRISSETIKAA